MAATWLAMSLLVLLLSPTMTKKSCCRPPRSYKWSPKKFKLRTNPMAFKWLSLHRPWLAQRWVYYYQSLKRGHHWVTKSAKNTIITGLADNCSTHPTLSSQTPCNWDTKTPCRLKIEKSQEIHGFPPPKMGDYFFDPTPPPNKLGFKWRGGGGSREGSDQKVNGGYFYWAFIHT